jgi:hypothetical protein
MSAENVRAVLRNLHNDNFTAELEEMWRRIDATPRVDELRLTPTPRTAKQPPQSRVNHTARYREARKAKLQLQRVQSIFN